MSAHWYKDGSTWRQTNAFWYNDGGTWREMAEVWYNDGGTWRQVHRRELRRPTASSTANSWDTRSNPSNAYDADNSTHRLTNGLWVRTGLPQSSRTSIENFDTWQTTSNTYNTLSLYISADVSGENGETGATSSVKFEVSTDGTNYTQMYLFTSPSTVSGSFAYTLSPSQNFANLKVRMSVQGASGGGFGNIPGDAEATVWDIFTVGTY